MKVLNESFLSLTCMLTKIVEQVYCEDRMVCIHNSNIGNCRAYLHKYVLSGHNRKNNRHIQPICIPDSLVDI